MDRINKIIEMILVLLFNIFILAMKVIETL